MIRYIIVIGARSAKLSEILQLYSEFTLKKAIERVRQTESLKEQPQVVRLKENSI